MMTTIKLSIGKLRGLEATSTPTGKIAILAFDHRQSFVKMLRPAGGASPSYEEIVSAKAEVVSILAPHASAVLLDPIYGAAQAIAGRTLPGTSGLMIAVEETGYMGEATARLSALLPNWSVEKSKRMGADAVKLLVYYHPHAGELTEQQEQLVSAVIAECQKADITLYLEAMSYSIDPKAGKDSAAFAASRPQVIAETASRLGKLKPDVLKLEFPVDAFYDRDESSWIKACEAVSTASPCPWAVLSGGVSFELFVRQAEVACKSGASGYIAGRAVWQEGIPLPSQARQRWLQEIGVPRLQRLTEIAEAYAHPWMDFYPPAPASEYEGWYEQY